MISDSFEHRTVKHSLCEKYILVPKIQQGRECTYNVILRSVRATIITVENQYVLHDMNVYMVSVT